LTTDSYQPGKVVYSTYSYQPGKLLYFDEMALDFDPEQRLEYLKKIARQTPTLT
jgi:hypothetical protein